MGRILRKASASHEFRAGQQLRSASGRGVISSALPVTDLLLPGTWPTATRTSGEGTLAQASRTADSREGAIFSRFPIGCAIQSDRPRSERSLQVLVGKFAVLPDPARGGCPGGRSHDLLDYPSLAGSTPSAGRRDPARFR